MDLVNHEATANFGHNAVGGRTAMSAEPILFFIGVPLSNQATNGIRATTLW